MIVWLWRREDLYYWVPRHCNNWRDSSWHTTTLRALQRWTGNTPPVFLKSLLCLSGNFGLRAKLLVWHTYRGLWRCSQGMQAGGHNLYTLPLPYSSLLVSFRKDHITLSGVLIFVVAARDTSISPGYGGQRANTCVSHRPLSKGERVLPLPGHNKRQQTQELSLSARYLLAYIQAAAWGAGF